jgi:hypothetical protein
MLLETYQFTARSDVNNSEDNFDTENREMHRYAMKQHPLWNTQ